MSAGYVVGDTSVCQRCGQPIWLSEFRPGEAAQGHGVWLVTEMAGSAACFPRAGSGEGRSHVPAALLDRSQGTLSQPISDPAERISEKRLAILERFGDGDTQDLCAEIRRLRALFDHEPSTQTNPGK